MRYIQKLLKGIAITLVFVFIAFVLVLSVRGVPGNPDHSSLNSELYKDKGPLELSPDRGRFALTFSIIEDKSFQFSLPVARFVTPDLGYKDGKFVSLFAPGVSFLVAPGYLVGKVFSGAQVGTYAEISLFALLNAILILLISLRLGANKISAAIAAFVFSFATPAFPYAVSLYQHHVTVFLMLSVLYLLIGRKSLWQLFFVWMFMVGSVVVDYPNFFIFLPIGIYAFSKLISIGSKDQTIKINLKLLGFLTILGVLVPIIFFLWVNKKAYDDPFQLAGTVKSVKEIDEQGNPLFTEDILKRLGKENPGDEAGDKTAVGFFKTRQALNGLYVLLISSERGVIFYAPVILFGVVGVFLLYRKEPKVTALLLSIIGANILLYSMWGDPWGGWAFGSRYLIPSFSLLAVFLAIFLTHYRKKFLFLFVFFLVAIYSIFINTLGALTTNKVPPKGEAIALEKVSGLKEEYTYIRNWNYLYDSGSKSFVYQTLTKDKLSAPQYFYMVFILIVVIVGFSTLVLYITARREK